MSFDSKSILIGIVIGVLLTIIIGGILSDIHIGEGFAVSLHHIPESEATPLKTLTRPCIPL